ncbi:DNA polymerase I [bacterium]|nr:DNA polymerase I [bacterium]
MSKNLYLLDGQGLIYRAYHALPYLSTTGGLPTNAIYGFASMILRLVNDRPIDYAVAAFDMPLPTVRHKQYEAYKAGRPPMPNDLSIQIPYIKEIASAFGMAIKELPGFEADDIIATLAQQGKERGWKVFILSGDLDCLQIVDEDVKLLVPRVGISDLQEIDVEEVRRRFGVPPSKIPDLKALVGDTSDNLPGVPGIGPKRASQLLEKFSSIEELFEKIDEIPESLKNTLLTHEEMVRLNKNLTLLRKDLLVSLDDVPPFRPDWSRLRKIFQELEMKNLLNRIPSEENSLFAQDNTEGNKTFVKEESAKLKAQEKPPEKLIEILQKSTQELALHQSEGKLHIATREREVFSFPLYSTKDLFAGNDEALLKLKPFLENEKVAKIGYNMKQLSQLLQREKGIHLKGISFDIMIADYLLNPLKSEHRLEDIYTQTIGRAFPDNPVQQVAELFQLKESLERKLEDEQLMEVFYTIELPLSPVLLDMEEAGIKIDVDLLKRLSKEMAERMRELEKEIYRIAGIEFNIASPKQLSEVLTERLKLPLSKKKKRVLSTDAEVLESLAPQYEIARKILEWRELSKCKGTYVDVLPKLADRKNRVHTTFNQCVTATGRLSSSEPNLQNIPIKGEWAKKIREAFIAEEGWRLISADYSQIELRILAHLSGDEALLEAFQRGEDIHALTASSIFGVPLEDVSDELRRKGKTVNFGIVYGISEFGLAKELGISEEKAKEYIDQYFQKFPKVKEYVERTIEEAMRNGYVRTIFGRKRPVPELLSSNKMTREFGKRAAINAPVQGSAADLIKLAMVRIHQRFRDENLPAKLLLQVHDELLVEAKKEFLDEAKSIIKEEMENVHTLSVPLVVKIGEGENWGAISH